MKVISFVVFLLLCFGLSCTYAVLPKVCVDPIGSESYKVTINYLFCFLHQKYGTVDTCYYNGCFWFRRVSSTGQDIESYDYLSRQSCSIGTVMDVGQVNCLSEVKDKPTSGYASSAIPILHHGYVIRFPDNTYDRFFIQSTYPASGSIDTLYIVRQYPF